MSSSPLTSLREAFSVVEKLSYCDGTLDDVYKKHPSYAKLFYTAGKEAQYIDFSDAPTSEQLKALADACPKATFGKNDQDVLDENYRKAGKMDTTEFSTLLSPSTLGLLDVIATNLLRGKNTADDIECQLYKLNVYGPGSFFKPHVDTPRGNNMIGTLVLVLPTKHEGGGLEFSHSGQKWTFQSDKMLAEKPHSIAYAAFSGDMQHEVLPVVSGYRVTLTYNLFERERLPVPLESLSLRDYPAIEQMRESLAALLKDRAFLPNGGFMAFGLSHRYPIKNFAAIENWNERQKEYTDALKNMHAKLRGPDAVINDLCKELDIEVSLKAVYHRDNKTDFCLLDRFIYKYDVEQNVRCDIMETLTSRDGEYCRDVDDDTPEEYYSYDDDFTPVVWIKPRGKSTTLADIDAVYGNDSSWTTLYCEVCLVAKVKPVGERQDVDKNEPAVDEGVSRRDSGEKPSTKRSSAMKDGEGGDERATKKVRQG